MSDINDIQIDSSLTLQQENKVILSELGMRYKKVQIKTTMTDYQGPTFLVP